MSSRGEGQKAACRCGHVAFDIAGPPILHTKCYCDSCRTAGQTFAEAAGGNSVVDDDGGTDLVLYRKDRIGFIGGGDQLREHRLKPESPTRRMVAACCGTPMFLEFTKGHWLSVYADRLLAPVAALDMRVMTADRPEGPALPDDVPKHAKYPARFILKLLGAWAKMGFRKPKVAW
ncbi:hypothetical protein ACVWZA_002390 [Sphingomonas sp. UYAg733]